MITFGVQFQLKITIRNFRDFRAVAGVGPGEGGLKYDEPRRGQVVEEEEGRRLQRATVCHERVRAIMRVVWVQHRKDELLTVEGLGLVVRQGLGFRV